MRGVVKRRHVAPNNMLALSKSVIGLRLTAVSGEISFSYRSQPMNPTDNMIKVVMERAWRWKLELRGNLGELEILTGKLYLDDLRDAVKSWEAELSNDGKGLAWIATVVGV